MLNFDVIHFFKLDFAPGECDFVSKVSSFSPILAVCELPRVSEEIKEGEEQAATEQQENTPSGAIRLVKVE